MNGTVDALSRQPAGATSSSATSGAYIPRWKRDGNVKPEPYRADPRSQAPPLKPGQYYASQIGDKLGVPINHSFLVSYQGYDQALPISPEDRPPTANKETSDIPMRKEVLHAILNYPGANPPSTEPETHIIWTRHNVDTVKSNIGRAYPFFTCLSQAGSPASDNSRVFIFDGHYRIDSADFATKEEVLEFVKAREQSKRDKPASVWMDKLNSRWLKVLLRKAPEQSGNPME